MAQLTAPISTSNLAPQKAQKTTNSTLTKSIANPVNPLAPMQGGENIATAFVLTGSLPISSSGTTAGYLDDYNEDCPYTGSTAPDVVYAYTPSADVNVDIDLCGSSYDTKVFVYENAATPGSPFACNDDFYTSSTDPCGQWVSKIVGINLIGGNTYYIVIDGYSGDDFGAYELEIRENIPCVWGVNVSPPVGAASENEVCGTDANGGCNMPDGSRVWEPVPSTGGSVSGTIWSSTTTRDTDWYELVLTQASSVVLTANADQQIVFGEVEQTTPGFPNCATGTGFISPAAYAGPCAESSIDLGVYSAGTYWFFVSVPAFVDLPCDNHYWITFGVTPETCAPPTALYADGLTTTSADLHWTAGGTESGWLVEVGLPGFTPGNDEHVFKDSPVTNSVTATGLSAATQYFLYVQADCGGTSSVWSGPYSFATLCDAAAIPYSQNFESVTPPAIPICTSIQNAGTGNNWATVNNPGAGFTSKTLRYAYNSANAANAWFFTQGVNLSAGTSYRLTFRYGNNSTFYVEKLKVAYGSAADYTAMTNLLLDFPTINQNAAQSALHEFTPASAGTYYFGFNCYSVADQFNLYVDDILIEVTPVSPAISITPSSKDYGTVGVGGSSSQVFTISNTGGGMLTIDPPVSITGTDASQFILTDLNSYPLNLTSGQSATVSVAFTPTSAGAKSANLTIVDNLARATTDIPLTGTGFERPAGSTCANPYPVTLPVVNYTDNTEAYGNDYLSTWVTPSTSYLNGYDFVAQFTLTEAGNLSGSVAGSWTGVIIVQDCPDPTTPAARLALGSGLNGGSFSNVLLQPGSYFAIVSTWPTPNFTSFTLNLSFVPLPSCPVPIGLTATGITTTTADLGWTELGTATSWDIEVVEFGDPPTGVPTHPAVGSNPYTVTGLMASTHYEFYVRAKCAQDSDWSVAKDFYTACDALDLPYYTDVTDVSCWKSEFSGAGVTNRWGVSASANAGGVSPEFICAWQNATGMARLVSPAFNTSGMSQIKVSFRQFYNDYGLELTGCTIKLRSSSDGINWTDEGFSHLSGDGDIPAELLEVNVSNNLGGTTYIAWEVEGNLYDFDFWYLDNINIEEAASTKTLNLTSVLPEGLYAGGGTLNQAKNDVGDPEFPGYADEITVELHDGAAYGTVLHTATVLLSTTGAASVTDIPAALNGNYWITVKHRNSVQTVSSTAVSFASDVVNQSFGTPADVYGGNLQLMSDFGYAIFGGDVTQDGVVDTDDMTEVDNDSADYVAGYVPSDVTGDGATDTEDMTIVDNNNANYVGAVTP
jgi:hypothetical protein